MFTGLIEEVGEVHLWKTRRGAGTLTIKTRLPLSEMSIGSSIAVNGACLTIVGKAKNRFTVDVSPETLKKTNLEMVHPGDPVNLERPLQVGDRLGGHFVTGHVDGIGAVQKIKKKGDFIFFDFRVPASLESLLVPKGSIAVDGISLTVNECKKRRFSVAVIPFTLENTNLRRRGVGDRVNLETDVIGKYIQQLIRRGG